MEFLAWLPTQSAAVEWLTEYLWARKGTIRPGIPHILAVNGGTTGTNKPCLEYRVYWCP